MKIVFWSNVHGQSGTTSNLMAIAVMSTLLYQYKNLVTQTHFNMNNLEVPLVSTSSKADKEFFMDLGIDALARCIKSAPLDAEVFESCSISLLDKQLNLLPGTTKDNREIFENDISKTIFGILQAASKYHDFVFIDTNSGKNELTMKIIKDSDIVIVCLNQNKSMLEDYSRNYEIQDKKVFYLIGNYDYHSRYNLHNLRKCFSWLKNDNSAIIPYNTEYMDAQSDGQVISYLLKNMDCDKDDNNSYFINQVKLAVNKLIKFAGIERR
jgi:MinD-like ATPase involved in chromosome partitioning or flagellar assembly